MFALSFGGEILYLSAVKDLIIFSLPPGIIFADLLCVIPLHLQSLEGTLRHPGDNRTQIRELGQTLIDGGILDELISEKLKAFNSRYEQLNHQVSTLFFFNKGGSWVRQGTLSCHVMNIYYVLNCSSRSPVPR